MTRIIFELFVAASAFYAGIKYGQRVEQQAIAQLHRAEGTVTAFVAKVRDRVRKFL